MTLLTIMQDACNEIGIAEPATVIGNTNVQIKQLLALSNREGQSLAARPNNGWEALRFETTFTTLAAESQGAIETMASGYRYIVNRTIWNRTKRVPVIGPIDSEDWQMLKASPAAGPFDQYKLQQGEILFNPVPAAGETCAFEYVTKQWCESSGGTGREKWAADSDVGRLNESLLTLGLIWRWKKAKVLDYAEDFAEYERQVTDALCRDGTKPILNAAGGLNNFRPGIFVPQTGYGQ